MSTIPPDPTNPSDDSVDEDYIDDPDLPGEVPAPTIDEEVSSPATEPGEQDSELSPDNDSANLMDPDGDPSPEWRPL